jgi:plasmid maintenance system antidote protein VapI
MTSLTARLKQATGLSDQQIANLTGRPRSTIQAVIAGKLADTVTPEQILPTINARLEALDTLKQDCQRADTNHGDTDQ